MIARTTVRAGLVALAAALAVSGCGAVGDNDIAARVEDAELTNDEFTDIARADLGDDTITDVDGDIGREIVSTFVGTEVLRADLAALGVDVGEVDNSDLPPSQAARADFESMVQNWASLPAETMLDDRVVAFYELGTTETGLICPAHILLDSDEAADDVLDQLAEGADFVELAAEASLDTGSAANGGFLGCYDVADFAVQFVPEFAEAAIDAELGEYVGPAESDFGFHVIRLVPAEQLDAQSAIRLRLGTFDERYEIEIDPRIGTWDPTFIVAPVG